MPLVGTDAATNDQDPALLLVPLGPDAPDRPSVVARVADQLRWPALLVDDTTVRVVAVAPSSPAEAERTVARGGRPTTTIVEKAASGADLAFDPGRGRTLVTGIDGNDPSRPLVPGGPVPREAGRLLVASGRGATRWATWTDGAPVPTLPAPTPTGRAPTVLVDDTFESLPAGGAAPAAWYADGDARPPGVLAQDPALTSRVLRLGADPGADPDPVTACRSVPVVGGDSVTIEAVVRVIGRGDADARLLTVRGSTGTLASVRRSRQGLVGWSTAEGRITPAVVPDDVLLRITVGIDVRLRTADIIIATVDGGEVARVAGLPWVAQGPTEVDEVCLRPAPGVDTEMRLDSLLVSIR